MGLKIVGTTIELQVLVLTTILAPSQVYLYLSFATQFILI